MENALGKIVELKNRFGGLLGQMRNDFLLFFRTLHRRLGKPRDGSLRVCRLHLSEQGGGVSGVPSSSLYAYARHMHGRAA